MSIERTSTSIPSGILLVNKPRGMTSHDVVDHIRKIAGIRRVGHAGTLDPLAEGLLIILIGEATKRQAEFMAGEKEYIAAIRLGTTSTTDDAEGIIHPTALRPYSFTATEIRTVLSNFVGEIEQVPPAYSAIKIRGEKAYEAARQGKPLTLKPRHVTIKEIELLKYQWPGLTIRVLCASGTYIRALARDIGQMLGCGAYLEALTRTRSGQFTLKEGVGLNKLTPENWQRYLLKP